jgi:hypothetical protein
MKMESQRGWGGGTAAAHRCFQARDIRDPERVYSWRGGRRVRASGCAALWIEG